MINPSPWSKVEQDLGAVIGQQLRVRRQRLGPQRVQVRWRPGRSARWSERRPAGVPAGQRKPPDVDSTFGRDAVGCAAAVPLLHPSAGRRGNL